MRDAWLSLRRGIGAHVETCRLDSSFYVGLVGVAGALLTDPGATPWRIAGAWLVPTLGWIASLYGGDYFDRDLDAVGKPQRPIPSGRMTPSEAFAGMVAAIALGTVTAVLINPYNLVYVLLAGLLGVTYSRSLKARGILGNIARGGPTAFSLLLGGSCVGATFSGGLVPIALMLWIHDSSSNLVGALCDRESDAAGGYRTFPVRRGARATVRLVIALDVCWVMVAVAVPLLRPMPHPVPYLAAMTVAVALAVVSIVVLLRAPRPTPRLDGLRAHEIIVVERLLVACGLIVGGVGPVVGVAYFVPSLAVTVGAQTLMRRRYEPSRGAVRT